MNLKIYQVLYPTLREVYKMARVNRAIELLEQGQPIYYSGAKRTQLRRGRESFPDVGGLSRG